MYLLKPEFNTNALKKKEKKKRRQDTIPCKRYVPFNDSHLGSFPILVFTFIQFYSKKKKKKNLQDPQTIRDNNISRVIFEKGKKTKLAAEDNTDILSLSFYTCRFIIRIYFIFIFYNKDLFLLVVFQMMSGAPAPALDFFRVRECGFHKK